MLIRSGAVILSFANRREQRFAFLFNHQLILVKQDRADCVILRERVDLRYASEVPGSKGDNWNKAARFWRSCNRLNFMTPQLPESKLSALI